jgi:hypothetical protein
MFLNEEFDVYDKKKKKSKKDIGIEFGKLFLKVYNYIWDHYTDCVIEEKYDKICIIGIIGEKNLDDGLIFKVKVNRYEWDKIDVYISYKGKEYEYDVDGDDMDSFKDHIYRTVYERWFLPQEEHKKWKQWQRSQKRKEKQKIIDPNQNRLRRLALLRQTLEGYEATLSRTKKGTREYETLSNEIETIKGRIRTMENAKNEGYNHVMSFQIFEKQYSPIKDDYVMITYAITGEPVPVQIKKVYPNNTYLVSFNVEGSTAKGAPDATIRNSDIISPYKPIRSPVGTGFISQNTNFQVRNTTNVNQVSNDMYL